MVPDTSRVHLADMTAPVHVSVMTPVYRPVGRYLAELHASLDRQAGVAWEWIVQVDGGRSALRQVPAAIRRDPRVSLDANGRWFGQSVTRNLALERVRNPLLQTVDADDLLLPGALATSAAALVAEPDLALVFGRTWELAADHGMQPGKNLYRPGRIEPGVFLRDWEQRGGSCSIVVGSAMWRTACIDAQGGWPATVAGMDVMLLLAVAETHPARCLDHDSYVYRCHPGQVHRTRTRLVMRPHYKGLVRRMVAGRRTLATSEADAGEAERLLARRRSGT
jgi:glycosyltransferase involved in cell wall biosynthesis